MQRIEILGRCSEYLAVERFGFIELAAPVMGARTLQERGEAGLRR